VPARPLEAGRRLDIEDRLTNEYKVGWTFISDVMAGRFDKEGSLRNQARFKPLNPRLVEKYRAPARNRKLPPVIGYETRRAGGGNIRLADGNHRLAASDLEHSPLNVYLVDADTDPVTLARITYRENTINGEPATEAESVAHAVWLVQNGSSAKAAATEVGLTSDALVKKAVNRHNAALRSKSARIDPDMWASLGETIQGRLTAIRTDEGLRAAAELAFAARLKLHEVDTLISRLRSSSSAETQKRIVAEYVQEFTERIQATAGGVTATKVRSAPTAKTRAHQAIGTLLTLPPYDEVASAYAPTERDGAVERLGSAIDYLINLRDMLRKEM
jgi:hypothetical protein